MEKHFALEKASNKHYYEKIKSEQSIDESLVTFLKNKVNKANLSINNNWLIIVKVCFFYWQFYH